MSGDATGRMEGSEGSRVIRVLVFAHTPPPHHGQSAMVQLMLDRLRGPEAEGEGGRLALYHVNCQFSDEVADIGRFQWKKVTLLVRYCWEAIRWRLREGPMVFYYVPAPGVRAALYRDWLVMLFCRPFFSRRVFHWHGVGLGAWLEAEGRWWERWLTRRLLGGASLSLVLGEYYREDAARFCPRTIEVVANGIPDPCPDFEREVLPARRARWGERQRGAGGVVRVLFLAVCMREKGLFDAVEAVVRANGRGGARGERFALTVAGKFYRAEEREEFDRRVEAAECRFPEGTPMVRYVGFVDGKTKGQLLRESDVLLFPSYYPMEGQPVSVIEAMACGMAVVAARWRSVPELFPDGYPGLANPQSPDQLAEALAEVAQLEVAAALRERFLTRYTAERFGTKMRVAMLGVGSEIRSP